MRGLNRNKIVVAIARELSGFVWAIGQSVKPRLRYTLKFRVWPLQRTLDLGLPRSVTAMQVSSISTLPVRRQLDLRPVSCPMKFPAKATLGRISLKSSSDFHAKNIRLCLVTSHPWT